MSALRRVLVEFDVSRPIRDAGPAWPILDGCPPTLPALEPEPSEALETSFSDPVGEAVEAALAEAATRQAAALAEAEARFDAALATARAAWVAEQGEVLARAHAAATAAMEERIAEAVAAVLEPFVGEAARRAAVDDLRAAVGDLVTAGAGGRIAVSGPQDLVEALGAALARSGIASAGLVLAASDDPEVTITADSSVVRTRLDAFMLGLRHRIEADA